MTDRVNSVLSNPSPKVCRGEVCVCVSVHSCVPREGLIPCTRLSKLLKRHSQRGGAGRGGLYSQHSGRHRQVEDLRKFEASLVYIVGSKIARAME